MDYINSLTKLPVSDKYILSKIKTKVVTYEQLGKYTNIDDLFVDDSFIILYQNTAGDIGHWCCVVRRGDTLSYFDSYGRFPDPYKYLKGKKPYLSRLLYVSPYYLEYSDHDYQSSNTATCGHFCIVRILFKYRPLEEFEKFMAQFNNDDEVVTAISYML